MLGSCKKCPNCQGTRFRRIKLNRTIQCETCQSIAEERCNHDLAEYYATTQTEEVHCVVSPDFLHRHIVDDIPNDPYCTPGFITAFRMLSPLREPVFAASARTLSGALAEMERLIGDALYSGYVGYNGRAPGGAAAAAAANASRGGGASASGTSAGGSGGDARHILVAYFEIRELASILGVDRETSTLAIRIFRYTASNTSLRNRNVESLATAAFVAAVHRRCAEYDEQLARGRPPRPEAGTSDGGPNEEPAWRARLRKLSVRDVADAANLDESEVQRYLKVVNAALRKQKPEQNASITSHMPALCARLRLSEQVRKLAMEIAELAAKHNVCARRAPSSVAASAIYMACKLYSITKTQTEICRATSLTEVTLRKVHKELLSAEDIIVPEWFRKRTSDPPDGGQAATAQAVGAQNNVPTSNARRSVSAPAKANAVSSAQHAPEAQPSIAITPKMPASSVMAAVASMPPPAPPLLPPPLPPGFRPAMSSPSSKGPPPPPAPPSLPTPSHAVPPTGAPAAHLSGLTALAASGGGVNGGTPVATIGANNATQAPLMMAQMMQNPAMQAFANAMAMMPNTMGLAPQFMVPPPPQPPPLPPKRDQDLSPLNAPPLASESTQKSRPAIVPLVPTEVPATASTSPASMTPTVGTVGRSTPPTELCRPETGERSRGDITDTRRRQGATGAPTARGIHGNGTRAGSIDRHDAKQNENTQAPDSQTGFDPEKLPSNQVATTISQVQNSQSQPGFTPQNMQAMMGMMMQALQMMQSNTQGSGNVQQQAMPVEAQNVFTMMAAMASSLNPGVQQCAPVAPAQAQATALTTPEGSIPPALPQQAATLTPAAAGAPTSFSASAPSVTATVAASAVGTEARNGCEAVQQETATAKAGPGNPAPCSIQSGDAAQRRNVDGNAKAGTDAALAPKGRVDGTDDNAEKKCENAAG